MSLGGTVPAAPADARRPRAAAGVGYLLVGAYLGVVLTKAEVVSWYRIQEMFRLDSFHMYGVIGSALAVAMLSLWLIARAGLRDRDGAAITVERKDPRWRRAAYGGTVFGLGWALTGACPGPIAALVGAGLWGYVLVLGGAMAGTLLYGSLRQRLPH